MEKKDFGSFFLFVNDNNENMPSMLTFSIQSYEICYNVQGIYTNYTRGVQAFFKDFNSFLKTQMIISLTQNWRTFVTPQNPGVTFVSPFWSPALPVSSFFFFFLFILFPYNMY